MGEGGVRGKANTCLTGHVHLPPEKATGWAAQDTRLKLQFTLCPGLHCHQGSPRASLWLTLSTGLSATVAQNNPGHWPVTPAMLGAHSLPWPVSNTDLSVRHGPVCVICSAWGKCSGHPRPSQVWGGPQTSPLPVSSSPLFAMPDPRPAASAI